MNNKFIAALIIAGAASSTVSANEPTSDRDKYNASCRAVYDLAYVTMGARQKGYSLPELMSITETSLQREMLIQAYGKGRHGDIDQRLEAQEAFANGWARYCYQLTNMGS